MTPNEMIESYVHEVARRLPHNKRNDVALELRALLQEELADRSAGHRPSNETVLAILTRFGQPVEVAARYHVPPPIIEPKHTAHFLIWSLGGMIMIAVLALLDRAGDGSEPILQWLGALVLVFGILGWAHRRFPDRHSWKPRSVPDPDRANRVLCGFATIGTLALPLFLYWAPETFVETLFLGLVPTGELALTPEFARSGMRALTIILLLAVAVLYLLVAASRRWWKNVRYVLGLLNLFMGLALAWHATASDRSAIFLSAETNEIAAPIFALIGAFLIVGALYEIYREWVRIRPRATAAPKLRGGEL